MNTQKYLIALAIGLSSILSACGKAPVVEVESEFVPYVESFEKHAAENGMQIKVDDLVIRFGTPANPKERGACEITPGETPTIIINQEAWAKMENGKREALMFHEMGHCVLRRVHKAETNEHGVPASIMNPYTIDAGTYERNQSRLLAELFQNHNEF